MMLRDKAQHVMRERAMRFPPGAIGILEHIVLSHHGLPEFGAAKIPATPEAIMVSILVMMWISGSVSAVIERYPTIKMLALAFLILIGIALVA